jgi:uncharacterized protein (TIGR03083 family)
MTPEAAATVDKLAETWGSLSEVCRALTAEQWDLPTECPGWSVRDNVSHLIGTERGLAGQPATSHVAPSADWVKNPIGTANENEVDARRGLPGADVLAEFDEITATRLAQLRAMTDEEWTADSWTPIGPGTLFDFLQIRILDSWVHEQDVRRAVGVPGNLDGLAANHTIDRLVRTIPATFGRRAGAPDGASLVFTLTGPVRRDVRLQMVDGRAQRLDAAPADPTVRIAMDSETFVLLATGRQPVDAVAATVAGDATLGAAVLANLNQMI